jgi:hypothetical protein
MCMSPHQMSNTRIEEQIQNYRTYAEQYADVPNFEDLGRRYLRTAEQLEEVLKERAEDGTYDTAGYQPGDRNETQRTEYQTSQSDIGFHRRNAAAEAGIDLPQGVK